MDASRFDLLARQWATRRTAVSGLVASLAGLTAVDAEGKRKKKKKKKKCKGGTIKCGKTCVDASTDTRHCGGCGNQCGNGQDCVGGACTSPGPGPGSCPAGRTQCSGQCVDTQSAGDHCGGCGRACGQGQRCEGGQCVSTPCPTGQILCSGQCVPSVGAHPCCSQADCGGPTGDANQISCDVAQHQCRCLTSGYGICTRTSDKRGICGACCEGGAGGLNCPGELGCYGQNFCTCPAGRSKCPGGDNRCYPNPPTPGGELDPTVCINAGGTACVDCTQGGTRPYVCCLGRQCADASGLPPGYGFSFGYLCGGCTPCPSDKACCNDGPGTAPRCKDTSATGGYCPPPGEG